MSVPQVLNISKWHTVKSVAPTLPPPTSPHVPKEHTEHQAYTENIRLAGNLWWKWETGKTETRERQKENTMWQSFCSADRDWPSVQNVFFLPKDWSLSRFQAFRSLPLGGVGLGCSTHSARGELGGFALKESSTKEIIGSLFLVAFFFPPQLPLQASPPPSFRKLRLECIYIHKSAICQAFWVC